MVVAPLGVGVMSWGTRQTMAFGGADSEQAEWAKNAGQARPNAGSLVISPSADLDVATHAPGVAEG